MTTTTLLSLPWEIRHQILRDAVSLERHPPSPCSIGSGRVCLRNHVDPYWTPITNIYVETEPVSSAQNALLQTSRQLRTETQDVLKATDARRYRLDVLFVKECGLVPTWLSFPRHQKHIDEVYVQMRISDPPDKPDEWLEAARYADDFDGSDRTSWNIMFLLTVYLLGGLHPTTAALSDGGTTPDYEDDDPFHSLPRNIAKYTIKTLIIDVLGQPADDADADADAGEAQDRARNVFGHCIFRAKAAGVDPAHKLARELWSSLDLALSVNHPHLLYGRLLHENIGAIEIRVNGVQWTRDDLTRSLCNNFGTVLPSDLEWVGERTAWTAWFEEVVGKRRRDGLWDEEVVEELKRAWG
ncbi:uncharacterized protein EI97DRAFT_93911 [Westerdykella ornata]|uniref:F-box domain-containing protein n=1 Tax=Westerdykella ornata TaxID=318751 RepID=A0A6A6JG16_WESOR|nr:uncharacterized protein EI97DRAFT_93911 [Westerdykella ornata]KAF2274928.1 hypothetical protein EI97DRAFT_93911 [Westerdykella ornata]